MEVITFSGGEDEAIHFVSLSVGEQAMYDLPESLPLDLFNAIAAVSTVRREREEIRQNLMRAAEAVPQAADVLRNSLRVMENTDPYWRIDAAVERLLAQAGLSDYATLATVDDPLE